MIQMQTVFNVADNSGAKKVRCIKVLGGSHHDIGGIGEIVVVSVQVAIPGSKMKKGQVARGVVVRTRSRIRRPDGSEIFFDDNAVVLITKDGEPIGTRVFGPVARELRALGYLKILSLAEEVL